MDPNNITSDYDSIVLDKDKSETTSHTCTSSTRKENMGTNPVGEKVSANTNPKCCCNQKKLNALHPKEKFDIDLTLYNHHPWKHVHRVPFDVNRTEMFEISCSGSEWATKTKHGRQTSCSKNKNLNGFYHVSKCKGSMCCTYEKCPLQLAKKPLNTKAFNRIAGHFICKICGHFVE